MTFAELIRRLANLCDLTQKQARYVAEVYADLICVSVAAQGFCTIPSLGRFYRKTHKARRIIDPRTRQPIRLPAFETLGFRASPGLRRENRLDDRLEAYDGIFGAGS